MDSSGSAVSIQVITSDEAFLSRIADLVAAAEQAIGVQCVIQRAGELLLSDPEPHIILMDLDSVDDAVLQSVSTYRQQGGSSWIVVSFPGNSNDRLLNAMRLGANDFMSHVPEMSEFRSILMRASQQSTSAAPVSKPTGSIISVFSNKGGVGTTMSAINLAASIAEKSAGKVAVVDLVLQHGDIAVFLDVPTEQNVVTLIPDLDRADASFLQSTMSKHAAGMHVLPAPYHPDEAELITADQITQLLKALAQVFEYVVVDLGNGYSESSLAVMDVSDSIFLITLPSLPDIRNTRRALDLFKRINFDMNKVHVVVNRYNAKDQIGLDTVNEGLGQKVKWTVPNDFGMVIRSINEGTAIRMLQSRHAIPQSFDKLVSQFVSDASGGKSQKGILGVKSLFRR